LIRDMLSEEGDISLSLLGKGDLYGLEGLAVDDPRCLPPYVSDFLCLMVGLGASGATKIAMLAVYKGRKGRRMTFINRVDFAFTRRVRNNPAISYMKIDIYSHECIRND